jgi:hypothetical protein
MPPVSGRLVAFAAWLLFAAPGHAQEHMLCPGTTVPLDISFASKPFVRLRLSNREGNFLIDTGANNSTLDAGLYGVAEGSKVKIVGSSLPALDGEFFVAQDFAKQQQFAPLGGYAGIIGTDVLSSRIVEFHYEAVKPYLVISQQRCPANRFEEAGYVSISQPDFRPTGTWWSWAKSLLHRADRLNLPVIYAQIGAIRAEVWLDSGWGYGSACHHATRNPEAASS